MVIDQDGCACGHTRSTNETSLPIVGDSGMPDMNGTHDGCCGAGGADCCGADAARQWPADAEA